MPEEVQVDEPEEMGAMSAEEAGDTVGWINNLQIKIWNSLFFLLLHFYIIDYAV